MQVKKAARTSAGRGTLQRRSWMWLENSGSEAREGGQVQEMATFYRYRRMLWALRGHRRLGSEQWPGGRWASAGAGLGNQG